METSTELLLENWNYSNHMTQLSHSWLNACSFPCQHTCTSCYAIYNSQAMKLAYMSANTWMGRERLRNTHSGILCGHEEELKLTFSGKWMKLESMSKVRKARCKEQKSFVCKINPTIQDALMTFIPTLQMNCPTQGLHASKRDISGHSTQWCCDILANVTRGSQRYEIVP